ncbi:MAG: hypothetical protein H0T59_03870, partial [Chloroflexi bacterium]|nr:hypothetical protein [Chloroflexota bacterium]
ATILDGSARIRLIQAPGPDGQAVHCRLDGRSGDHVSLLPVGGPADVVTTSGLVYPLAAESLLPGTARGLSNVRAGPGASVTVGRGQLLVIESPATL